jgi:serine protease
MQKQRFLAFTVGLAALMMACTSTPAPSPSAGLDIDPTGRSSAPAQAEFVPGEVIVKFKSDAVAPARLTLASANLETTRQLGGGETLYTLGGSLSTTAARESVLSTLEALRARDDVEFAQPNYLYYPMATPNDTNYRLQWHYPAVNLPTAWDLTTGSSSVVIAVLDTGKTAHPDLSGKFVGGYDFVSSTSNSSDGNGRDSDATDPGDSQNSYHGTHVSGTVAAVSNNNSGVAGVCWNCKVLPVRVLGFSGGSSADISDGIRWSAGLSISGVPTNANPAKVINMSLGGERACSADPTYQNAINAAYNRGASIVVSAGNSNKNASGFVPASCSNVITVAATDYNNARAPYSNFGATVEVSAPGGDTSSDRNRDGYNDGVLSTLRNSSGNYVYSFYQGTSMAAPHVSGVIGLMLSRNSSLTPAQVLSKLQSTARAIPTSKCSGGCGSGLIDANAAVR